MPFDIESPAAVARLENEVIRRGASVATAIADNSWSEPAPLQTALPPVPALEPALLPGEIRGWVADVADRLQCPLEYPAVGALVALASVVGRQIAVRPLLHDDWTVVPNLWGAIVGRPGLLKTPALAEMMRPLNLLEARAREKFETDCREFEAACLVGKAATKDAEKRIAQAVRGGDTAGAREIAARTIASENEAPTRRRYLTSDTTVEALGVLLAANPRGLLIFRDELTGWLRDLDREGREGSRAFYLEAWNGTGRYSYDRIGRGTIDIEAACVSILGSIQPGPLSSYMRDALDGGGRDDGLLQRFQLVVWPDPPAEWVNVDRSPDNAARAQAQAVYERLDQLDPAALGVHCDDGGLPYLRPDQAAYEVFCEWRSELEASLRSGVKHPAFEASLAKQRSLVPTLALLIHLIDHTGPGPIGRVEMLQAVTWAKYLEEHAGRLYAPALDPALHAAVELDKRIRAGELASPFRAREAYRHGWRLLDRRGIEAATEFLADLGWLRSESIETGGRLSVLWHAHPAMRGQR